jgi:indole-3-glycerol phosphate synthase/phosphoribosylanthranilate isomerase
VLEEIVARKRADVAKRMESVPYSDLSAVPTSRRFAEALKKPGSRFILECKKASPSEGLIRKNFDVAGIAAAYKNFADAVSILTDEPYFQGSLAVLRSFRELLDQPILAKDFVIGPYQVREARSYGADAALLILSVLDDETYRLCADEAARLSMDVLTEVHSEAELDRALRLNAPIIGINNRNLGTLKVDLDVYRRLVGKIPDDRLVVCESGIGSHEDTLRLGARTDAFLVGGLLMKSARIDLAVRRLIHGGVKVCGLASPEDAEKSWASGATFGGLIFAGESPRRVDAALAREIRSASPLPMVGVFVNDEVRKIATLVSVLDLAAVQLHGEESDGFVEELRGELPKSCEIWKAKRVGNAIPAFDDSPVDRVLFDSSGDGARGGTGRSFDWSLLSDPALALMGRNDGSNDGGNNRRNERNDRSKIILAGGITPDNARRASELGCFAIDVNSGIESSPGKKDHYRIEKLFKSLRGGV